MGDKVYTLAILLAILFLASQVISYINEARFKRKHGCKPETRIPQLERIIGYDIYKIQAEVSRSRKSLETTKWRYDTYGSTWSAVVAGRRFINTIETENIKTVLSVNFKEYGLGARQIAWGPLLGAGIFTTDGAQWEHSRSLVRPNFTKSQVADLNTFETHIQKLITKIPTDGSTVDLQTLFFQLTLDSATQFLFGESVSSLSSTEGSAQEQFGTMFDLAQNRLARRSRLAKLVWLFKDKDFDVACEVVHEFVDNIINKALEKADPVDAEKSIDGTGEPERYVFLTEMLKATRDPKQLRDELLNVLLAGRDTTASLLSHTFHVLARRPDIWNKLKAEIDELQGQKPDYDTLRDLKYLKYLLNESPALRLYPVVPANGRFALNDTVLPLGGGPNGLSPVFVPKGTLVAYSTYVMHRRKDVYGADAEEFRPERWAPEEGLRPGWAYLPFNGGPRICVGQQFALTEAAYTIVRMVQQFAGMENRDPTQWVEGLALTLSSGNGVKVAMVPR
ncbi:Cytochrome P450 monooxygenase [Lachnellula hyalina]|uniref:Cytochrome P450 monooxygenase n=1 Tax=Lachnellula hyalina TaxID=1316788 RepID=A0A8H8RB91_9HELO|nr:Cytochrome P450 monooxygenase [Lachnellula hyalina]TVY30969.1 Cytochrome P450 monooxygenase [Lachnellula hyalina]